MQFSYYIYMCLGIGAALILCFKLLRFYVRGEQYAENTSISNKIVIITGGNAGIGKANAIDLAKRGGKIYIACRDKIRGEKALNDIRKKSGSDKVYFLQLDLASLKSIREFSDKFHKLETKLDILINNAGLLARNKSFTEDGFEMHMGVNHLGHFLLTNLLLNLLKNASPSRIVVVTSDLHKKYKIDKNDLFSDQKYVAFQAYGISKIANILFCKELSKRLEGTKVTVNCCHPGTVRTEILKIWKFSLFSIILMIFGKTPMEGAQTQIKLSVDPKLENVSGKYFVDCKVTEPSSDASNDETAKWLWETSSKNILTHVKYNKSTKIDNKIVVITGGSTGIGKACAIDLAKRGGKIYIACRNEPINEQAFKDIRRKSGSQNVYFLELDLASLKSVIKFSKQFHQLENRLDILINNAGVMIPKKQLTEDGFEMHMGVNYLGHFLLTNLVIDMLKVSAPSRIILVSSIAHKISSLKQKDLMSNCSFSMFKAYGMSKLAIILFTKELSRKLEGTQVTVNCCNPGVANTSIIQYILGNVATRIYSFLTKEPEEAAQNYIKLAVDPDLESVSGKYFEYCVEKEPSTEANDIQTAKWLWDKSVELVKFKC